MKRASEGELGKALREVDLAGLYVYRLPDPKTGAGVSNWKPCDYMVWTGWTISGEAAQHAVRSAWFEAKDTDQINVFPFADLRPSQLAGIRDAHQTGIPYWLVIYWRKARHWTISDAWRVLEWSDKAGEAGVSGATSIPRELLMSRFGIDSSPVNLTSTLKNVLLGEV